MKIIECPRDAMQGWSSFIPTEIKISYVNQLLRVGFDTIDFGSFVSPKAIPQMRDTARVLNGLRLGSSNSRLLVIVANLRGAQQAADLGGIDYLGFPLSLSETFQLKNTNRSIAEAMVTVKEIRNLCENTEMELVTYLSMGFGNPYNDPYNEGTVGNFVEQLADHGIEIISLADTIGISNVRNITYLFKTLIPAFPKIEFGAHLHAHPANVNEKIVAAYKAGCRRFDGALGGYGGCPMAEDKLVGNIPTESLLACLNSMCDQLKLDMDALKKAIEMIPQVFSTPAV